MCKGFTLIEILAVVLIVAILTSVAVPQYRSSLERSKFTEVRQMLPAIYDASERLAVENLCENWNTSNCRNKIKIDALDVDSKIKKDGLQYRSKNFTYSIDLRAQQVTAVRSGGRWNGVRIIYDGDTFICREPADNYTGACARQLGFTEAD